MEKEKKRANYSFVEHQWKPYMFHSSGEFGLSTCGNAFHPSTFCQLKAVIFLAEVRLCYHLKKWRICTVISPETWHPVKLSPLNGVVKCPLLVEKENKHLSSFSCSWQWWILKATFILAVETPQGRTYGLFRVHGMSRTGRSVLALSLDTNTVNCLN